MYAQKYQESCNLINWYLLIYKMFEDLEEKHTSYYLKKIYYIL